MSALNKIKEIFRLPAVTIQLGNEPADKKLFESFNSRHPRLFLVRKKTVGVGLIDCSTFSNAADYIASVNGKNSAAYFSRKAVRAGYRFESIDANRYADAIHAIHHSAEARQGIPLDKNYLKKIENYPSDHRHQFFGVFNNDELVAYLWIVISGQVRIMNRIMGHADHLKDGVMYLLVTSFVENLIGRREADLPLYVMYDTMLGASGGLRMFKERCGFRPYRVKWMQG
ncbi:MAG: hypothetical protein RIQ47_1743 [Bacteroidota bacterium]|jgi:hypothetical protein